MNNYLFSQGGSGTKYTLMNFNWSEGLYSTINKLNNMYSSWIEKYNNLDSVFYNKKIKKIKI